MAGKLIAATIWSFLAVCGGGLAFLFLTAAMTGSDLRNRSEMAIFLGGSAVIAFAVIGALVFVWMRAFR